MQKRHSNQIERQNTDDAIVFILSSLFAFAFLIASGEMSSVDFGIPRRGCMDCCELSNRLIQSHPLFGNDHLLMLSDAKVVDIFEQKTSIQLTEKRTKVNE